ncbi:MAG: VCBS repeat-containing protein [Deltaproteobacteria bacterium]|nr:VCBS repeat-containing protein [Deltaproteobacteria bacterium]
MKTHRLNKQKYLFIAITLVVAIIGMPVYASAKINKVAVVPFKINSEKDLSYLKDGISSMFESRLSWEGKVQVVNREISAAAAKNVKQPLNESNARSIGSKLKADYILFGNLTVFGNSVSIDAKMVDVSRARETLSFYNQSQGMNEVIPRINIIAEEINQKVFGRKTKVSSLPGSEYGQKDSTSAYAHPEAVLRESTRRNVSGSPFIYSGGEGEGAGFRKTRNLKIEIRGLSIGDVDGDGRTETVFISPQKLYVYRFDQGGFVKIQEIPGQAQHRYIGVDVADINNDGVSEIFVSCVNDRNRDVQSFVVEWDGKEFKKIVKNEPWYYRVINHPMFGKILVGQKRVASSSSLKIDKILTQNAFKLEWDAIKEAYIKKDRFKLPEGSNIFGLAIGDVQNNRTDLIIGFDNDDHLRIFNHAGKEDWTSEEEYGGSENFLEFEQSSVSIDDPMKDKLFLPHRIFITDLNENGKNEIIVVKNHSVSGKLFKRYRRYSGAQVQSLTWNGLGLAPLWHTRKVSGYFSDYQLGDIDDDGDPEIIISVVSKRETTLEKGKSAVIVYELNTLKGEDISVQESD